MPPYLASRSLRRAVRRGEVQGDVRQLPGPAERRDVRGQGHDRAGVGRLPGHPRHGLLRRDQDWRLGRVQRVQGEGYP